MKPLLARLLAEAPVVTDGAWGSQFLAAGLAPGEFGETWNLTHPERVEAVARAYADAGSRVILTNTFRANRLTLAAHGMADRMIELNRAGVEISRRASGGRALVFASMGPTGKLLVMGNTTREELSEAYAEQSSILAAAGPDAIIFETMSDLEEARIGVQAAARTGLPVIACMVYDSGKNKDRTMMGVAPETAARGLEEAGADVIGTNCGQGPEGHIGICRRLRSATSLPLWIKPNAGLPKLAGGKTVYQTTPEDFARHVPAILEAGAAFIGGCCGTTPDFIRAIAAACRP